MDGDPPQEGHREAPLSAADFQQESMAERLFREYEGKTQELIHNPLGITSPLYPLLEMLVYYWVKALCFQQLSIKMPLKEKEELLAIHTLAQKITSNTKKGSERTASYGQVLISAQ